MSEGADALETNVGVLRERELALGCIADKRNAQVQLSVIKLAMRGNADKSKCTDSDVCSNRCCVGHW